MASNHAIRRWVRTVALFEAAKGLLVVLAGVAAFSLINHDVQAIAGQIVAHLHLNPARRIPEIFLEAARSVTDFRLRMLAFFAFLYALVRFIEAYGLWFGRRWAEWFAALSGGVYLPFELFELYKGFSWLKGGITAINLVIVACMVYLLAGGGRQSHSSRLVATGTSRVLFPDEKDDR